MKKSSYLIYSAIIFLFACTKAGDKDRDTIPPVVTLNGNATVNVVLNSSYTDDGATATDNVDGTVEVTSNYTPTNPNVDSIGNYQIKYTAKDLAGNKGYGYRNVIVENAAASFAGNYIVTSISGNDTTIYNQVVTFDRNLNNRIHFSDFGSYSNNHNVFANIVSGVMTLPLQYAINIGVDHGQPCDVVNHSFQSSICTIDSNGFTIEYSDVVTAPSSCPGTSNHIAVFVKQ